MFISKNITYLRTSKGLQKKELGILLGYRNGDAVYSWENGRTTPPPKALDKLAKFFNCTVDQILYTDMASKQETDKTHESVRINVYGSIPAGIPIESIEDIDGWEEIPKEWTSGGREYFALKVRGDSMFPKYVDGDIIIVRKQEDCENGQDCVVYINGYDATLKKVLKMDDNIVLQPLNAIYEPIICNVNNNIPTICGVVVELRRSV